MLEKQLTVTASADDRRAAFLLTAGAVAFTRKQPHVVNHRLMWSNMLKVSAFGAPTCARRYAAK